MRISVCSGQLVQVLEEDKGSCGHSEVPAYVCSQTIVPAEASCSSAPSVPAPWPRCQTSVQTGTKQLTVINMIKLSY